jgi:hypothetical protein
MVNLKGSNLFFAKHADIEGYPEIAGLFATWPRVNSFDL